MNAYNNKALGNIIICGAPRAGTTSLFRYLSSHLDIAPSYKKELNYFLGGTLKKDSYDERSDTLVKYIGNFPQVDNEKWTMEASPAYMHPCYLQQVILRMKKLNPDIRMIMMIRNPTDRLYSEFQGRKERQREFPEEFLCSDFINMLIKKENPSDYGVNQESAHLVAESLMVSAYVKTIEHYLKYFDSRQLKLIFTESLAENPRQVMIDVCKWLNLPSDMYDDYLFHVENKMVIANNKGLYRFSLRLNQLFDPLLSRMPYLRKSLRDLHCMINVSRDRQNATQLGENVIAKADVFFTPYNSELRHLIISHWPEVEMPQWLEK